MTSPKEAPADPVSPEQIRYATARVGEGPGVRKLSAPRNYYLTSADPDIFAGGKRDRGTSSTRVPKRPSRGPSYVESIPKEPPDPETQPVVHAGTTRRFRMDGRQLRQKALAILNSVTVQSTSILCVLLSLFLADAATATSSSNGHRVAVSGVLTGVFVFFVIELVSSFTLDPGYRFGLRFFTDLVGTVSVTFDVSFLLGQYAENSMNTTNSAEPVFHAVRAARVARLARLASLTRVIRLLWMKDRNDLDRERRIPAPTSIAKNVTEAICQQAAVFIIIMAVLVVPQLFNSNEQPTDVMAYLQSLDDCQPGCLTVAKAESFCIYFRGLATQAIQIESEGFTHVCEPRVVVGYPPRDLSITTVGTVTAAFNIYNNNRLIALQNMYLILCIMGCLFFLNLSVMYVSNTQVLAPLERLIAVIQSNASAVLGALQIEEESPAGDAASNNMLLLEETIAKLSKLAAHVTSVGGDTGSYFLKQYMSNDTLDLETRHWIMGQLGSVEPYEKRTSGAFARPGSHLLLNSGGQPRLSTGNSFTELLGPGFYDALQSGVKSPIDEVNEAVDALLDSWDLDVFQCSQEDLKAAAFVIFERLGVFSNRFCSTTCARNFISQVAGLYRDNPYHNFRHAFDVLHTLYRFIQLTDRRRLFSPLEKFALAVAAIGHDIDHPGLTSNFLITTRDPLAMIYNDTSVLENHHTSTLYGLLASSPDADVLGSLDDGTWRMVRKIVNAAIAHTDMSFHFKMVSQAEIFLELHAQSISLAHTGDPEANKRAFANQDDRVFMMNLLLHSADISNPAKPFGIYDKWTTSVLEEFFAQGDLEKEMGLPVSPGFDRVTTSRAGSQINFIEFVLTPMFATVIRIFPELVQLMQNLVDNRQKYAPIFDAETDAAADRSPAEREEEKVKMARRLAAFMARFEPILQAVKNEMPAERRDEVVVMKRAESTPHGGTGGPGGAGPFSGGDTHGRASVLQQSRSAAKRRESTFNFGAARATSIDFERTHPLRMTETGVGHGLAPAARLGSGPEPSGPGSRLAPTGSAVRRESALGASVIPEPFSGGMQRDSSARRFDDGLAGLRTGASVPGAFADQDIKEESTSDGTENVEESRHSVARSLSGRLVRQLSQQVESVRGMKLGQFPPGAAQGQQQGTFHAAALPPEEEAEQKQQRSGNNSDADES